ncbi:MAG TPA: hypothetical protein VLA88_04195 [Candidatus Saccharimonadales bacterium]|nr:hypothetical protein [Candidatus Saccharimonadales bacterium]
MTDVTRTPLPVPGLPANGTLRGVGIGKLPRAQSQRALYDLASTMHAYATPAIQRIQGDTTGAIGHRAVATFSYMLFGVEVIGTVAVSLYVPDPDVDHFTAYIMIEVAARQGDTDIVVQYTSELEKALTAHFHPTRGFGLGKGQPGMMVLSFGMGLVPAT